MKRLALSITLIAGLAIPATAAEPQVLLIEHDGYGWMPTHISGPTDPSTAMVGRFLWVGDNGAEDLFSVELNLAQTDRYQATIYPDGAVTLAALPPSADETVEVASIEPAPSAPVVTSAPATLPPEKRRLVTHVPDWLVIN